MRARAGPDTCKVKPDEMARKGFFHTKFDRQVVKHASVHHSIAPYKGG